MSSFQVGRRGQKILPHKSGPEREVRFKTGTDDDDDTFSDKHKESCVCRNGFRKRQKTKDVV